MKLRRCPTLLALALLFADGLSLAAVDAPRKLRMRIPRGVEESVKLRREDDREFFGPMAPGYLLHKQRTSLEVANTWAHTLPSAGRLRGTTAAAVGNAWVNLGPTTTSAIDNLYDADSGRPSAVLPHPTNPDIVYLAQSGGGVYKATNATSSGAWNWSPITDGLPTGSASGTIAIGDLVFDPSNPNTLLLGLGDGAGTYADQASADGIGLYKSTDAGATWSLLGNWLQAGNNTSRIRQILCVSSSLILVGGNDGLWRSVDSGAAWTRISVGAFTSGDVWSITKLSSSELVLSRTDSGGSNGSIFYSSDAGLTWTQGNTSGITAFDRATVRASAASGAILYGIAEHSTSGNFLAGVLKSTDKGHTWALVNGAGAPNRLFTDYVSYSPGSDTGDGGQGFYNHCLVVDPDDANRLFVGSNLALWRSMDGGSTWQQVTHWYGGTRVYAHADWHAATVYSNGGTKAYFFCNDGGISILRDPWRTTIPTAPPGGSGVPKDLTFIDNSKNVGLPTHLVYNVGSTTASNAADARYRVIIGLQDNGSRVRTDAGGGLQVSTQFDEAVGGDGFACLWHPVDANLVLASLYNTRVQRSTNGGNNFAQSVAGIGLEAKPFRTIITQDESDSTGNTIYTGSNTIAYKSSNFGSTWTPLAAPFTVLSNTRIRGIAVAKTSPNTMLIPTTSSLNLTTNGGSSWIDVASAVPNSGGRFSNVWIDSLNASTMYLTSVSLDHTKSHLWKSINGGTTWSAIDGPGSGFPAGGVALVIKNLPGNSSTLFVGTDYGVYQSTNGGTTWVRLGTGLPSVRVNDIYIAPDSSFLRAATFGRGVWEFSLTSTPTGPTINTQPGSQTVTVGQQAIFTVTATASSGSLSYQWKKNGINVGSNANSYTTAAAILSDSGSSYSVAVTDATGTTTSATAMLTVNVRSRDLNGDGTADILDLAILARAWGATSSSSNWNVLCDLDGLGATNGIGDSQFNLWLAGF